MATRWSLSPWLLPAIPLLPVAVASAVFFWSSRAPSTPVPPRTISIGESSAWGPTDRGSPGRSNEGPPSLSTSIEMRWSASVGHLDLPPVVRSDGTVLAVSDGVCQGLDASTGKTAFHTSIGEPSSNGVLLADETLVVTSGNSEVVGIGIDGRTRFRTQVEKNWLSGEIYVGPMLSGGFVVCSSSKAIAFDDRGQVVDHTGIECLEGLTTAPDGSVVFQSVGGAVFSWKPHDTPQKLGLFHDQCHGGVAVAPATATRRAMLLCAQNDRIESLDWSSHSVTTLATPPVNASFREGVSVAKSGAIGIMNSIGEFLEIDAHGSQEVLTVTGVSSSDGGLSETFFTPLVADNSTVIYGVSSNVFLAGADFSAPARIARCGGQVWALPAGADSVLISCSDGTIKKFANRKP